MLKFLTHKLRTQSLNEDLPFPIKATDDHDSGTESDDEHGDTEDQEYAMESEADCCVSAGSPPAPSPLESCFLDSALPSDSDHNGDAHSSEEELEVINSVDLVGSGQGLDGPGSVGTVCPGHGSGASTNVPYPEKRKWSQVTGTGTGAAVGESSGGSSDEEVQECFDTPVEFRTSPPLDVHKPGRSQSPPPKLFHFGGAASSPRRRHHHRHGPPRTHQIQRPCLDFEKMQQLKERAITTWRYNSDHGGELSVFCW